MGESELKKTQFYVQTASGWLPIYEMPVVERVVWDFGEELEDMPSLRSLIGEEISFTVQLDSLGFFAWLFKWETQKSVPKISRK